MKKTLGIIVLGLLLSGNGYANEKFQGAFICKRSDNDLIKYPIVIDEVNNSAKWGSFHVGLETSYDKFVLVKHHKDLNILETFAIDRFSGKFKIKGLNTENKNEWEYYGVCKPKKRKF